MAGMDIAATQTPSTVPEFDIPSIVALYLFVPVRQHPAPTRR
jgi:hypothetical protein